MHCLCICMFVYLSDGYCCWCWCFFPFVSCVSFEKWKLNKRVNDGVVVMVLLFDTVCVYKYINSGKMNRTWQSLQVIIIYNFFSLLSFVICEVHNVNINRIVNEKIIFLCVYVCVCVLFCQTENRIMYYTFRDWFFCLFVSWTKNAIYLISTGKKSENLLGNNWNKCKKCTKRKKRNGQSELKGRN